LNEFKSSVFPISNTLTHTLTHTLTRDPEASFPPSREDAKAVGEALHKILEPRKNSPKYDPEFDAWTRKRLEAMKSALWEYANTKRTWGDATMHVARMNEHGGGWARKLRKWCRNFMSNKSLPKNPYGKWVVSLLMLHDDLRQEVTTYLQSCGRNVQAQ